MLRAHKIELRPTEEQVEYLSRACGTRRHCFNQLLAHFKEEGVKWSKKAAYEFYRDEIRPEFEWYLEVSSRASRNAIDDLDAAFKHFFRRVKAGQKPGFPRFKRKDLNDSFALRESNKFGVDGRSLRIEKLRTRIKMRQHLRFEGTPRSITISKKAGKYYASIMVETPELPIPTDRAEIVGVDLGIKSLAALSDGTVVPANQKLKKSIKKLKKRNRQLSKKKPGSNRRAKAKLALQKLHARIARQRMAVCHEVSDMLTKSYDTIVLEDLNVAGMTKNHCLARAVMDAGFGMLRQFVEYKALARGCTVVLADRFFPSTKTCYSCGVKHEMPLAKREMKCECGWSCDRDLNAALNLEKYGRDTLRRDLKRTPESCVSPSSGKAGMLEGVNKPTIVVGF